MPGREYGFLGRSGFPARQLFCMPIDVRSTGEKNPNPVLLLPGLIIYSVFLQVFTAEATASTKKVDVGLLSTASSPDADANGLVDGLSTAAAGVVRATMDDTTAQTIGALLKELTTNHVVHVPCPWIISKADTSFTYTLQSTHTEVVADIYIDCFQMPVPNA